MVKQLLIVTVGVTAGSLASGAVAKQLDTSVEAYKTSSGETKAALGVGMTAAFSLLGIALLGGLSK
jgi:hypothetical protein